MKTSLDIETTIGNPLHPRLLGAAVEWELRTGRRFATVRVMVGTCRAAYLQSGKFDAVVREAVEYAARFHASQINGDARMLGATLDETALAGRIADEFLPRIGADLGTMTAIVAEITAPNPSAPAAAPNPEP